MSAEPAAWKRALLNCLVRIAAPCAKDSLAARLAFAPLHEMHDAIAPEALPAYVGGGGGGVADALEWARGRYMSFPRPPPSTLKLFDATPEGGGGGGGGDALGGEGSRRPSAIDRAKAAKAAKAATSVPGEDSPLRI